MDVCPTYKNTVLFRVFLPTLSLLLTISLFTTLLVLLFINPRRSVLVKDDVVSLTEKVLYRILYFYVVVFYSTKRTLITALSVTFKCV